MKAAQDYFSTMFLGAMCGRLIADPGLVFAVVGLVGFTVFAFVIGFDEGRRQRKGSPL